MKKRLNIKLDEEKIVSILRYAEDNKITKTDAINKAVDLLIEPKEEPIETIETNVYEFLDFDQIAKIYKYAEDNDITKTEAINKAIILLLVSGEENMFGFLDDGCFRRKWHDDGYFYCVGKEGHKRPLGKIGSDDTRKDCSVCKEFDRMDTIAQENKAIKSMMKKGFPIIIPICNILRKFAKNNNKPVDFYVRDDGKTFFCPDNQRYVNVDKFCKIKHNGGHCEHLEYIKQTVKGVLPDLSKKK